MKKRPRADPVRKRKTPAIREKRRIVDIKPPGLGPWWAFMMVNVDSEEDSKKQTEIRLDTSPELVNAIKNAADQGDWAIVMKLGPFVSLDFAGAVFADWSDGTRGPGPRIAQGICLWNKYEDKGVQLCVIGQSKSEVQEVFRKRRENAFHAAAAAAAATTPTPDDDDPCRDDDEGTPVDPGHISVREILAATAQPKKRKSGPAVRWSKKK